MADLLPHHRRAALTLNAATLNHRTVMLRPEEMAGMGLGEARRIVTDNVERWAQRGLTRVGWGSTMMNPSRQEAHGIDEPIVGALMASMVVEDGQRVALERFHQPLIGATLAFRMNMDLPDQSVSKVDIRRCTSAIHAAITVADTRLEDGSSGIAQQADNGGLGLVVMTGRGKALTKVDVTTVLATVTHNGKEVGSGSGRSLMGDPIEAAAWVATTVAQMGCPVKANEVIVLGACTPVVPLTPGEWTVSVPILGECTLSAIAN